MTPEQQEALSKVRDGGCLWQGDASQPRYLGKNQHGAHFVSDRAVDLFASGHIDRQGKITDKGRAALP